MKRFLFLALLTLASLTAIAQKIYGDKQGWTVYTTEDEFTGKRSHYMRYFDQSRALAASFFLQGRFAILEWYDGRLYFDITFDAIMDRRGHIPDEQINYELRVNLPNHEVSEDSGRVKLSFGDVEEAGETFFGTFVMDADIEDMKRGQSVAVRWYDPIRGKQTVRKISLAGFTKCYDKCLDLYKQDKLGK